jgi:hypothetical protein
MPSDDISAPGWDAIDHALKPLYFDQTPKHNALQIEIPRRARNDKAAFWKV